MQIESNPVHDISSELINLTFLIFNTSISSKTEACQLLRRKEGIEIF